MSAHPETTESDPLSASNVSNWDEPGHLRELHVERGWAASDIARAHDLDPAAVRDRLKEIGVFQGQTHPPKSGLARKLWERGLDEEDGR